MRKLLGEKGEIMNCNICPRECGADREKGEVGACGCDGRIFLSRAALHHWEEPPISYKNGSGTVFFSGCNLRCVFCQNREISRNMTGKEVSEERLYQIFSELKEQGAHNINLVTPTHYTKQIIPVLKRAKEEKFPLPIIWNSGGYEKAETVKRLKGLVDIYLPDLK
ncbi:MAG: 4Fe-4S cluster-binding domain-containing protein, partial [Clostridia bacterium]|nr:4Fe-4S cluster-binding domain-containing protein [Clostridia bacterium]